MGVYTKRWMINAGKLLTVTSVGDVLGFTKSEITGTRRQSHSWLSMWDTPRY